MGEAAKKSVSYDDVLNAPENMTAEILAGELHLSPRPNAVHQTTASFLGADLVNRFGRLRRDPGGWLILVEVELHLGLPDPHAVVMVPDLSGWRRDRMPRSPRTAAIAMPPDWVCEILSPGSRNIRRDRLLKADEYHRANVQWMWIVDPVARLIEVYHRAESSWSRVQTHGGEGEARLEPFDAVPFDISEWWAESDDDDDASSP